MNERIRELARQAGMVLYPTGLGGIQENTIWGDRNVEKFAELIIRECLDIISPYAVRMENFDGGHPISEIKQHFGVE